MAINILLFVLGLVMLIKGGDWFVDGAVGIARRFRLPELLIGATVVSIGTTLPEVMVSAQGALAGSGGMAYGNAIGSVICNTALIAAITVTVRPSRADRGALALPVAFFFAAAVFYAVVAYFVGEFTRPVGIILLCMFVVYILTTVIQMKKKPVGIETEADNVQPTEAEVTGKTPVKEIIFLIVGAVLIALGARLLVDNGTAIAQEMGVPDTVIALTFVALGTSLPELVTAITSLVKGHGALSLGNIIGANLFNLVLVSGVATVIAPFAVPTESRIAGFPTSLAVDIPVMLGVMLLLTLPALMRERLSRVQGIILLCIYAAFCVLQFAI